MAIDNVSPSNYGHSLDNSIYTSGNKWETSQGVKNTPANVKVEKTEKEREIKFEEGSVANHQAENLSPTDKALNKIMRDHSDTSL